MTQDRLAGVAGADARAFAFHRLADQHLDAAYRLAYAILHDPSDAQDATHDAFVTAWRRWATLRDPGRFQAWFDRILVNTCRHRLRDAGRHPTTDLSVDLAARGPGIERGVVARDMVAEGLAGLTPDQRTVIALRYARDLTVDQIAGTLGIRAGTVKSRLHYALRRLQATLEPAAREEEPR